MSSISPRVRAAVRAAAVLAVLAVSAEARAQLTPGDHARTIIVDGRSRVYDVHVPPGYDGSTAVPLVIDFHGFTSNKDEQAFVSGMIPLSDVEGFIVVHPQGISDSWNGGICCGPAMAQGIDDVAFARAIVIATATEANIDVFRVYATGLSNGGAMSHRLGCEAAAIFAAVAPMAFPLPLSPLSLCQPVRPIGVLHFAGLDDTLVPYGGGGPAGVPSAATSFAYWRDENGCGMGPPDETVVTGNSYCETYTGCDDGVEVGLCSIDADDVGPFPGHILYFNQDLVLAEVAWDFLSQFTAPPAVCGDGIIGAGETCDDGNAVAADGCGATCLAEACYACAGQPSVCVGDSTCQSCERTVLKESAKLAQASAKAIAKCELGKIKGLHADPCPDGSAADALAKASSKFTSAIGKKCGGGDQTCNGLGANGIAEIAPGALRWPVVCPNLESSAVPACSAPIEHCGDLGACIECIQDTAIEQTRALTFDDLVSTNPAVEPELNKCQQTIGKTSEKFLSAKSKILQKCWDARIKGKHGGTCPNPAGVPGTPDRKAADAIAKAESKHVAAICKACGGSDQSCDAAGTTPSGASFGGSGGTGPAADLTPVAIGFAASCPAVTVPGGPPCGEAIATLTDVVECLVCVAEFKVDCMDRTPVPQLAPYPAECNP
jgi:polyhydroxybutyrate depolymerase